ncbi:MAG: PQQ-binding-like beta-propeller repeat protein [Actinomycetota bacterium]
MNRARIPAGLAVLTLCLSWTGSVSAQALEDPCVPLDTVNDRCPAWTGSYGSGIAVDDFPQDLVVTPNGGTIVTLGATVTTATGTDVTLVAHDAEVGSQRWAASLAGSGAAWDTPAGIAVSPDGTRVVVAATTCESATALTTCDLLLAAFDPVSGDKTWETRFDGPALDQDSAAAVVVSPEGSSVYVAGLVGGQSTGPDAALLAFEALNGELLWTSYYDAIRAFDVAHLVAVSEDGERVFTSGPSVGGPKGKDYLTIAHDAETGERLWVARRDDHGGDDSPTGLVAGAGRVIVTGTTDDGVQGLQADYATVAYDEQTGQALWEKIYNGGTNDLPLDLAMAPDGSSVYATGMSRGASSGYDMATVAYSSDGSELWTHRYNGLANNGDAAWAVEVSPDGKQVYVAGDTLVPNVDYFHAVIAYSADDGVIAWTGLHRGGGSRGGSLRQDLAVDPDGSRVYYTGQILAPTTDTDFLTLAYESA